MDFSSTTGWVWWKTEDATDLDYTPLPLITRDNNEKDLQFTQEFRFASAENVSVALLADNLALKWQAGTFFFTQNYEQLAVNTYSPGVLPFGPFPVDEHSPEAQLDDHGIGIYGRATLTVNRSLDAIVGLRGDFETKKAVMSSSFVAASRLSNRRRHGARFQRRVTTVHRGDHATQRTTFYGTAARGFKAGGFNPASPPGTEAYDQEHSWNYEGGAKTSWLAERLVFNAAAFFIDWNDLQVNVPNPQVPAQFYIANAGNATSKGFEIELSALPRRDLDIFGGFGYTNARFGDGSVSGGVNVSGNKIAGAPDFTGNASIQFPRARSDRRRRRSGEPRSSCMAAGNSTMRTRRNRGRIRSSIFAVACGALTSSSKDGSETRSTRSTCRLRSRTTRASRRQEISSASRALQGRSASGRG